MRIIAGEFRGRKLLAPASEVTRPITDRVKQSLFDILTPVIDEAVVYDCFCGTGSMGLESLSRGASHVTFFDEDRSALERLGKNIDTLKIREKTTIVAGDIFRWAASIPSPCNQGEGKGEGSSVAKERKRPSPQPSPWVHGEGERRAADIIFFDPPYRFLNENAAGLKSLAKHLATSHLSPTGILIFRHDVADSLDLPGLTRFDVRTYGSMSLEFLRPANAATT